MHKVSSSAHSSFAQEYLLETITVLWQAAEELFVTWNIKKDVHSRTESS